MSKRNRIGPPGANWWDKEKPFKPPRYKNSFIKCSPKKTATKEYTIGEPLIFPSIDDLNDAVNARL